MARQNFSKILVFLSAVICMTAGLPAYSHDWHNNAQFRRQAYRNDNLHRQYRFQREQQRRYRHMQHHHHHHHYHGGHHGWHH